LTAQVEAATSQHVPEAPLAQRPHKYPEASEAYPIAQEFGNGACRQVWLFGTLFLEPDAFLSTPSDSSVKPMISFCEGGCQSLFSASGLDVIEKYKLHLSEFKGGECGDLH
jgi:hypothetical protein